MIDATVNIIDRLIQLINVGEANNEKYFLNFVEPTYNDAELIINDYINLFRELIVKLERNDNVLDVIKWLEMRRYELLPVRTKVRSFLGSMDSNRVTSVEKSMDKFQKGIWGVLKGGLSLVEEGKAPLSEYGWHDHTVLDLLYYWSQQPVSENRNRYIENAKAQLSCIELAWKDVTDGYKELKVKLIK